MFSLIINNTYHLPSALTYLILTKSLEASFTEGKTKDQRSEVTCLSKQHSRDSNSVLTELKPEIKLQSVGKLFHMWL